MHEKLVDEANKRGVSVVDFVATQQAPIYGPQVGDPVWFVMDRFVAKGQPRRAEVTFGHVGPGGTMLDLTVTLQPDDNPVPTDQDSTRTHLVVRNVPAGNVDQPGTWYPVG